MRNDGSALDARHLQQLARDQRIRELGDARSLVEWTGGERRQQKLAHELVARVDRVRPPGAT